MCKVGNLALDGVEKMILTFQELGFDSKVIYDEGYVEGDILLLYLDVI